MSSRTPQPIVQARAARLHQYGEALVVEQAPVGPAGPGEVVVELAFAGVNPFDAYNADGLVAAMAGPLPRTLGGEGAGWRDGKPVLVFGSGLGLVRDGTWASAAVVPETAVVPLPASVDLSRAAALGSAGLTAWFAAEELAQVGPDDRVIVLGASGGVGQILVALAKVAGAEVWALVGTPAKAAGVADLGVDHVLVGGPERLAEVTGATTVFDGLGGAFSAAAVEALAPGGLLLSYGVSAGTTALIDMQAVYRKGLRIQGFSAMHRSAEQTRRGADRLIALAHAGALRFALEVLPLDEVSAALGRLRSRAVSGKLVLDLR